MRYLALADGFVDSHYVCAGEEFEYSGKTPSWATLLESNPVSASPADDASSDIVKAVKKYRRAPAKRKTATRKVKQETFQLQEQ